MDVARITEHGLQGLRNKLVTPVLAATAQRTGVSERRLRTLVGGAFLILALRKVVIAMRAAVGELRRR